MRNLKITFFLIGMLIVTSQTVRHLYVRVYYDIPSVLDKYDDEIDKKIKHSSSLDTLLLHFDKAYNEVIVFEKDKTEEELKEVNKNRDEPYNSKTKYKKAIRDWEKKEEKIHEVIVFWIVGLILVLLGSLIYYRKGKWLGLSLIIVGFVEMIWWSSPSISTSGSHIEFLKFLNIKLFLSLISISILIVLWEIGKKFDEKSELN
jgi:hypothetical protein